MKSSVINNVLAFDEIRIVRYRFDPNHDPTKKKKKTKLIFVRVRNLAAVAPYNEYCTLLSTQRN